MPVAHPLATEHGALMRQMARLQQRVSEQLHTAARRHAVLESQNLRLRAELVRLRTAIAWGMPATAVVARVAASPVRSPAGPTSPALREAQAVICQTGCTGHAHPWLEEDGQCRRTGLACERLEATPPAR